MNTNNKHTETIFCPECGTKQIGTVVNTIPFPTILHECENCAYIITESEWEKENPLDF